MRMPSCRSNTLARTARQASALTPVGRHAHQVHEGLQPRQERAILETGLLHAACRRFLKQTSASTPSSGPLPLCYLESSTSLLWTCWHWCANMLDCRHQLEPKTWLLSVTLSTLAGHIFIAGSIC